MRPITNFKNFSILGSLVLVLLLITMTYGCSKKKQAIPLLPLALTGTESANTGGNKDTGDNAKDSNGVTLPSASPSAVGDGDNTTPAGDNTTPAGDNTTPAGDNTTPAGDNTTPAGNNTPAGGNTTQSSPSQEVATHGPAKITGKIVPTIGGLAICKAGETPPTCAAETGSPLDLAKVVVKLIKNVNGQEVVVATTNLDANGNYSFDIADLNNGTYRVLTNSGDGLNFVEQDFQFTFDPTGTGATQVALNDMNAERLYYTSGPAIVTGKVTTPGFSGDGVTVASGALTGVTVQLKDADGTVLATTTTDGSGNYSFCYNSAASCPAGGAQVNANLGNGNYTVTVKGDSKTEQGQNFGNQDSNIQFSFSGNDQAVVSTVTAPDSSLSWNAATSSSATISLTINNAAIAGDANTVYTIKIKDAAGNVVATATKTGSGNISLSGNNLPQGVYTVEITSSSSITQTTTFNFIPHPTGGDKAVALGTINVVPKKSNVIGSIQGPGGNPNPVPGAVVNFRPSTAQPPSSLAYLTMVPGDDTETVNLRNAAKSWIMQACSHVATCQADCAVGGYQLSCVLPKQGAGPWTYDSYANKVYEVNGTNLTFAAAAGKWDYYISAPGYENSSVATMILNGQDVTVPAIFMVLSDKRSQIKGSVTVLDMLTGASSYTPNNAVSGLFAVMLGNTDSAGNPVAHVTLTSGGAFAYNGSSKVVPLSAVTDLNGDGVVDSTDRIMYAVGAYSSAPALSATTSVAGAGVGNSVDTTGGTYNFKQSSYQIVIVDPMGHILTTPKQADNSAVVTNTYTDGNAILDLAGIQVLHESRRKISGTITDAISTGVVNGATVALGTMDSNNVFQQNVRRDCTADSAPLGNSAACILPSNRVVPGSDQIVPTVTTDANGNYAFNNVDPGSYVLKISKNGIDTYIPVTVTSTGDSVVNAQIVTSDGRGNLTGAIKTTSAGGNLVNFTGTYSLEIIHPTFGTRPTSGVQPASLSSGPSSFTNVPTYNAFSVNAGAWKVRFVSAGYVTVEGNVNIQANATTTFDIITMVPGYQPPANVSGRVLSAMTNQPVGNLTIRIRPGVNNTTGDYVSGISAVTTAADGSYAIPSVPAGNYTMEVSGAGYMTTFRTVVSAGPDTPPNQNVLISPSIGANEVRIVLSWDASPKDLDSHMEYGSAKPEQVVWNDKSKLGGDLTLDIDVVTGYGPETVTVKGQAWTQARRGYSVYNWTKGMRDSSATTIANSGATVRVFKQQGLVRTYTAGSGQAGLWWQIFCLDANKNIIDVGQTGCNASDFFNAAKN